MTSRHTEKKSCPVSMSCSNPQASDPFYCLPSYLGHTLRNPPSPLPQTQAASSPSLQYHSPCPREGRAYLSDFTEPSFSRTRTALSPPLRFAFSPGARAGVVAGLAFCVSITCSSPSSLSTSAALHSSLLAHSGSTPASEGTSRGSASWGHKERAAQNVSSLWCHNSELS